MSVPSLDCEGPLLLGISGGLIICTFSQDRFPVSGRQAGVRENSRSLQVGIGNYGYYQQRPTIC